MEQERKNQGNFTVEATFEQSKDIEEFADRGVSGSKGYLDKEILLELQVSQLEKSVNIVWLGLHTLFYK